MTVCPGELNGSPSLNLSGDCLHFTNLKQLEGSKVRISPDVHVGFRKTRKVFWNFCFETSDDTYSDRPSVYYEHGLKGELDGFLSECNPRSAQLQFALNTEKWREANRLVVEQMQELFNVSVEIEEVSLEKLMFAVILVHKFSDKKTKLIVEI